MAMDEDSLGFHKATDSGVGGKSTGPGACIITGLSAKAPLPAPFLPAVHHPHPTRSGFPECHLV